MENQKAYNEIEKENYPIIFSLLLRELPLKRSLVPNLPGEEVPSQVYIQLVGLTDCIDIVSVIFRLPNT